MRSDSIASLPKLHIPWKSLNPEVIICVFWLPLTELGASRFTRIKKPRRVRHCRKSTTNGISGTTDNCYTLPTLYQRRRVRLIVGLVIYKRACLCIRPAKLEERRFHSLKRASDLSVSEIKRQCTAVRHQTPSGLRMSRA